MDADSLLFMMQINDGYAFRNTMTIIKQEVTTASMFISRDKIQITFISDSKRNMHDITLDTNEFVAYHYNIVGEDGTFIEEYPICFNTTEFLNTTKSIGRKDGIRVYWSLDDQFRLNVQEIKASAKDPGKGGCSFVNILPQGAEKCTGQEYAAARPSVQIQARDFADLCNQANLMKCAFLEVTGRQSSIYFNGILPNRVSAFVKEFDRGTIPFIKQAPTAANISSLDSIINSLSVNDNDPKKTKADPKRIKLAISTENYIKQVQIQPSTFKALSKIHNISPQGNLLKIYFEEEKPIKIENKISTYGTYVIYLK